MEKLLKLLNEYAHTYADHYDDTGEEITIEFYAHADGCFQYVCDGSYETLVDDVVTSKRYGFIKRLVDNEKINLRKLDYNKFSGDKFSGEVPARYYLGTYIRYSTEKEILMTLAIQDEPIEFLVSILK